MMNLIVPLDMSETAERSLPFARTLAGQLGARVILVSVIEVSSDLEDFVSTREFKEDVVRLERDLGDYLEGKAASFENVAVETVIRMGSPVDVIASLAESFDRAALVMASHGRTGFRRHLIGSVTMQMIHQVSSPVFVVAAGGVAGDTAEPVRHVLVPLDGSELAEHALSTVTAIFDPESVALHILRVAELGSWRTMPFATLDYYGDDAYRQAARETVNTYLERVAGQLAEQGFQVTYEAREGAIPDGISAAARDQRSDLIAMGTHGRTGINRLLMGSVAESVLRESTVPVLLQRPQR